MPEPFCTVTELAAYLGKPVENQPQAELALALASDLIRAEVGQTISFVANDVVTLVAPVSSALDLPERPVVDVTSVVADGILDGEWSATGDRLSRLGGWPRHVTVTYSHGFSEIPGDVRAICLSLAGRMIAGQAADGAISAETIGNYRVDYARSVDATRPGLLDAERDHLRRRYRRTVGMVSLR